MPAPTTLTNAAGLEVGTSGNPLVTSVGSGAGVGSGEYETVAASQTAQVLGATGAVGDYLAESTYSAARHFSDFICDDNEFEDCTLGIAAQGATTAATVPFCGNIFVNVTTPITNYAGQVCGYVAERFGTKLIVQTASAAPTTGTWVVGDRALFASAASYAASGAICTVAGNPGTWV